MLRKTGQAMHARRSIVTVTTPSTVLVIVAIAPKVFRGTHTSLMVAEVIKYLSLLNEHKGCT
jgi:hypothetical protein